MDVMKDKILRPKHPERICWGCDRYCPVDDLACGNGTIRTAHLAALFGDDWLDWAERRSNRSFPKDRDRVNEGWEQGLVPPQRRDVR